MKMKVGNLLDQNKWISGPSIAQLSIWLAKEFGVVFFFLIIIS